MRHNLLAAGWHGARIAFMECRSRKPKLSNVFLFWLYCFVSLEQRLITVYRIGHELDKLDSRGSRLIQKLLSSMMHRMGSSIAFSADIGCGPVFPHPFGIVIGEGVVIGDGAMIWQQVTIGSAGRSGKGREYPVLGASVRLYAKSTIVGAITVGDGAVVAAGAVVLADIPAGVVAAGVPARVLKSS